MPREKTFYRIREVATEVGEPTSTLKHWEKEFPQIKPRMSDGGTRIYMRKDIEKLKLIRSLIREQGMTISGVQRYLQGKGANSLDSKAELLKRLEGCLSRLRQLRDSLPE